MLGSLVWILLCEGTSQEPAVYAEPGEYAGQLGVVAEALEAIARRVGVKLTSYHPGGIGALAVPCGYATDGCVWYGSQPSVAHSTKG
jgi:hypothetical protein